MQDDIISVDVFHDVFDVAFFPYVNLIESFVNKTQVEETGE